MCKKVRNIVIYSILIFFVSITTVFARQMTLQELSDELEKNYQGAGYAYLVGDFVFTSKHKLTTTDLMFGATSILGEEVDPDKVKEYLTKMTVYQITRITENFQYKEWKLEDKPALGTDAVPSGDHFNIKFIDYNYYPEISKANLVFDMKEQTYTDVLKNTYGVDSLTKLYDGTLKYDTATNKLTGLMLRHKIDAKAGFTGEDETNYYLPFVIEVPDLSQNTTVKIKDDKEKTAGYTNFDIQTNSDGKNPGLLALWSLNPKKDETHSQLITIEIDIDGDLKEYGPTTYTIDYSGLTFQEDSSIKSIELNQVTTKDNQIMEGWGYDSKKNKNLVIKPNGNTFNLSGTLVEQNLRDAAPFGEDKKEGYYFHFTFVVPDGIDKEKVAISQVTDETGETDKKQFLRKEFDENGNLTILFRFPPETTKCTDANNCKIYYKVDLDGDGKEYLPVVYTLDYKDNLIFEKYSKIEISDLDSISDSENEKWKGWKKGADYETHTTVDAIDPYTVNVTGFIPIFDDRWVGDNPFTTAANDYYIGFKIKKSGESGSTSSTVKFLHDKDGVLEEGNGENNTITQADFGEYNEIYVLKHINPLKVNSTKKFTITVDFDDDKEDYAPYTVTVNWSGLDFQSESGMTKITPINSEESANGLTETDKTTLTETWGYSIQDAGGFSVADGGVDTAYNLQGTVKEQTIKSPAGFSSNKGYFVAVKIEGPSKEDFPDTENKWTVQLQNESGSYMDVVQPNEEDYKNGFIVALIKLKDAGTKKFTYKIDFDGNDKNYIPYEETIDYSGLTFLTSHVITFDDKNNETQNKTVTFWDGDKIIAPAEFIPESKDSYHEFAYWNKEDGTKFDTIELNKENGDMTLVPHWNLYSDKFISDVLEDLNSTDTTHSPNFRGKFEMEYAKNSGKVTIHVVDPTTKLSEMNHTSIPGTIAYILLKDEIQEISLSIKDNTTPFTKGDASDKDTLKNTVIEKAKSVYSEILTSQFEGKNDETVTLSEIAHKEGYNSFTLKLNPDRIAKTVTLVKESDAGGISSVANIDVPTEYVFTFESDSIVVQDESSLKSALQNPQAKTIFISKEFNVTSTIDITRDVTINGGNHKLTSATASPIFKVTKGNVTIDAIELADGNKTAILVESGSLTSTGMTITGENLEAGIEAKSGTLNIKELTYGKETYEKPAVKASKSGKVSVTLEDNEKKPAVRIEKEKINKVADGSDSKNKDEEYEYYNYYNKVENSRIYETKFFNHEGGNRLSYTKYNYYDEIITPPNVTSFKDFEYEGEKYTLLGFTQNTASIIVRDQDAKPEDVIVKENLKATSDKHYWASFRVTVNNGVEKVSTVDQFKTALKNEDISAIYITTKLDIDLTSDEELTTINRNLSIIGDTANRSTIRMKKLTLESTADDVFFHRLDLVFNAEEQQDSLIEVNGKKFSLWQTSITNNGSAVDYAINYKNNESVVDVRWNTINSSGFDSKNIKKAYINVEGKMAAGTHIYLNTFNNLTDQDNSAIIIKGFADNASLVPEDEEPDIIIESNTFNTKYAFKLLKEVSSQKADIKFAKNSGNTTIAVECDESSLDFSGIKIHDADLSNVKAEYIKDGTTSQTPPTNVKGLSLNVDVVLPEMATVSGLTKNEDGKYSGVINQSSDGNFYIPVTLSSKQFNDRVSKVTVTDPNENKKEYLYYAAGEHGFAPIMNINLMSAETSQNGTMTLNLEAIKSSRITGENGKLYKIEVDYNGDKQIDTSYEIDYNNVDTLEEVINNAAKNTQETNSLTVNKNNKIKGLVENFTFKYDKEKDLTLYSENNEDLEYTFRYKNVVPTHNGPIIIAVKKIKESASKPKIGENYEFANFFKEVSKGYHEISLLQDVMKQTTTINAINKVKEVEGKAHTYEVTLNKDKLNDWLDNAYLSSTFYDETQQQETETKDGTTDNENVAVEVVLDETDHYIVSIKTKQDFSVQSSDNHQYQDNRIDVTFTSINETDIQEPLEFLAQEGSKLTVEEMESFYEECKKWHHDNTGGEIYEG